MFKANVPFSTVTMYINKTLVFRANILPAHATNLEVYSRSFLAIQPL